MEKILVDCINILSIHEIFPILQFMYNFILKFVKKHVKKRWMSCFIKCCKNEYNNIYFNNINYV